MKTNPIGIMLLLVLLLTATTYAEVTDLLKPKYQRQEQELRRIMEQLSVKGLKYDVVSEKVKTGFRSGWEYRSIKTVRIPKDIEEKIWQYDRRFALWNFSLYLEDQKYSFYMGILNIRYLAQRETYVQIPQSVIKHDKKRWAQEFTPELKERFLGLNSLASTAFYPLKDYGTHLIARNGYYAAILFASISPDFNKRIFSDRVYETGKWDGFEEASPIMPIEGEYGKRFADFMSSGDNKGNEASRHPHVVIVFFLTNFASRHKNAFFIVGH